MRVQLERKLYGWDDGVESRTIGVYMHRLRKTLGADFMRNARGVGHPGLAIVAAVAAARA